MPDKKQSNESTSDDSLPVPTQPPKDSGKDYSALPQKPITLKREIRSSPALKGSAKKSKRKTKAIPTPTPRPKRAKAKSANGNMPSPDNQGILSGISREARDAAEAAAQREGLELGEWLERMILERVAPQQEASSDATDEMLIRSLKTIDERLRRLENNRGFWIRFWDRFMEQR